MENLVEKFLENEKLSESSTPIYRNVLMIFLGYCRENQCTLDTLNYSDIFKSLDYYISERRIKFENTARFYISAIKEFLVYCNEKETINKELLSTFGYGNRNNIGGFEAKLDKKINELIKHNILKKEQSGIEINSDELSILISKCNSLINKFNITYLKRNSYNSMYNDYISALCVKIISYTGIKVGLILNMKINDLNFKSEELTIYNKKIKREYRIKIPKNLVIQLQDYLNIRKELLVYRNIQEANECLFIAYNGKALKDGGKNSLINQFIYKINDNKKKMSSSTACVAKRAIIDMISAGMSPKLVEDLTGYGQTVIQYCKERVDEVKREEKDTNSYLDKYMNKRNDEFKYYDIFK